MEKALKKIKENSDNSLIIFSKDGLTTIQIDSKNGVEDFMSSIAALNESLGNDVLLKFFKDAINIMEMTKLCR
jgi:hypothetical protein